MAARTRVNKLIDGMARAFPAALWLVLSLYLLGQTGFWADDYFHNRRALDGSVPPLSVSARWPLWSIAIDRGFFIRPLYYQVVPALTTVLWDHAWVLHVLQAVLHAGMGLLVWRFMLVLGIGRVPARVGALLFLAYPGSYEAVFWIAAIPTVLSAMLMVGVLFLVVGLARRERRGWWRVAVVGAGTFVVCCLNEQPASAGAAIPFLYWAALPNEARMLSRSHLVRVTAATTVCGCAILVYTILLMTTAPSGARGSAESFTTAAELPGRLSHFVSNLVWGMLMQDFASGAWSYGLGALGRHGWQGLAGLSVLLVTALAWIIRRDEPNARSPAPLRRWPAAAFGAILFVAAWVPVVMMVVYEPDSRMRYWAALGLVVSGAALFSREQDSISWVHRAGLRTALVAVLLWWTILHIGIQRAFQARFEQDRWERAQLLKQVPSPRPYTLFQPVRVEGTGIATGASHFDEHFHGVWWYPWTTRRFTQLAYGREDVTGVYHQRDGEPVLGGNERGLLYKIGLGPRYATKEEDGWRVPWERVVLFVVERDGTLRIVSSVLIDDTRVGVPQAGGVPEFEFRLPRR